MGSIYTDIEIFICDVDGVLTDGVYQISNKGEITKSFYTRDFYGIEQLLRNGMRVVIISQSHDNVIFTQVNRICDHSEFWSTRYVEDGPLRIISGVNNKKVEIDSYLKKFNMTWDNVAYIGDAENDVECMKVAGVTCCPSDAIDEVYKHSTWPSNFLGGKGAVYEFAMAIIEEKKERGKK